VYDRKAETVTRKVQYTECVPYTETIRVPVTSCASNGDNGHGHRGGLFRRGH
jgi:hypothetical protein